MAEVEEEVAAGLLDLLLLLLNVVALEAEMVHADEVGRVLQARAGLALVLKEREVDVAVAEIDAPRGRALGHLGALESERFLVEVRGGFEILDDERDVADAGRHAARVPEAGPPPEA